MPDDEKEMTKRHVLWAIATVLTVAMVLGAMSYAGMLRTREHLACIQSGGNPAPNDECKARGQHE